MSTHNSIPKTITLPSGYEMPRVGYGVYQIPSEACPILVVDALSFGYRHIDTATAYCNDVACAYAIEFVCTYGTPSLRNAIVPRSEIFFTTKIPPSLRGYDAALESIRNTVEENAGLEGYVDLYMIHAPYGGKENRLAVWRAMRDAWKKGWIRSLGVSNYSIAHMEELREWIAEEEKKTGEKGSGGTVSVGQWEIHPWCPRNDILAYCQTHSIVSQAYAPVVRGTRFCHPVTPENPNPPIPLGSEYLYELASKYEKTPAQILLRWNLQKGCVPIVKTMSRERLKENIRVWGWELGEEEVKKLETTEYKPVSWDPVKDCKD